MQLNHMPIILILSFLTIWCSTFQDKIGIKNDHLQSSYRRKHTSTSDSRYPQKNLKHNVDKQLKYNLRLDSRIVGGYPANIEDFPFVAELAVITRLRVFGFCGATIVSLRWTISAAHCFKNDTINDAVVKAKEAYVFSNSTKYSEYTSEHRIVRFHSHELFNWYSMENDIAVIKVKEPFTGVNEKPIHYVKRNYMYREGTGVTVLGWGYIDEEGPSSQVLRYVNLSLSNFEICHNIYVVLKSSHPEDVTAEVTDRMVCAYSDGKDACSGDSGGPLVQNNRLIGIVSFGYGCAIPPVPGVYTRISMFSKWIKSKIKIEGLRTLIRNPV